MLLPRICLSNLEEKSHPGGFGSFLNLREMLALFLILLVCLFIKAFLSLTAELLSFQVCVYRDTLFLHLPLSLFILQTSDTIFPSLSASKDCFLLLRMFFFNLINIFHLFYLPITVYSPSFLSVSPMSPSPHPLLLCLRSERARPLMASNKAGHLKSRQD